jgi:hypothetical protein
MPAMRVLELLSNRGTQAALLVKCTPPVKQAMSAVRCIADNLLIGAWGSLASSRGSDQET